MPEATAGMRDSGVRIVTWKKSGWLFPGYASQSPQRHAKSCAIIAPMLRRTKIIATLGPATDDAKTLGEMINEGLDVVRLNF